MLKMRKTGMLSKVGKCEKALTILSLDWVSILEYYKDKKNERMALSEWNSVLMWQSHWVAAVNSLSNQQCFLSLIQTQSLPPSDSCAQTSAWACFYLCREAQHRLGHSLKNRQAVPFPWVSVHHGRPRSLPGPSSTVGVRRRRELARGIAQHLPHAGRVQVHVEVRRDLTAFGDVKEGQADEERLHLGFHTNMVMGFLSIVFLETQDFTKDKSKIHCALQKRKSSTVEQWSEWFLYQSPSIKHSKWCETTEEGCSFPTTNMRRFCSVSNAPAAGGGGGLTLHVLWLKRSALTKTGLKTTASWTQSLSIHRVLRWFQHSKVQSGFLSNAQVLPLSLPNIEQ